MRFSTSSIDWYSRHFNDHVIFFHSNYLSDLEKFRRKTNFYEYLNGYNFRMREPFRKCW